MKEKSGETKIDELGCGSQKMSGKFVFRQWFRGHSVSGQFVSNDEGSKDK